jgi:hypothetical protein
MAPRTTRQEEVQAERRRRNPGTLDRMQQLKLAVPEQVKEANPGHTFRWVNDFGNRIHAMTVLDDWDKVEGVQPIPVDTRDGKPVYAHLCKKRTDFYDADQREKVEATRVTERSLVQSKPQSADPEAPYTPGTNSISTGYQP